MWGRPPQNLRRPLTACLVVLMFCSHLIFSHLLCPSGVLGWCPGCPGLVSLGGAGVAVWLPRLVSWQCAYGVLAVSWVGVLMVS